MTASEAEACDQIAFSRLQILQRFVHFREYFVIDNRPEDAVTETEVIPGFLVPIRIMESCAIDQDNLGLCTRQDSFPSKSRESCFASFCPS